MPDELDSLLAGIDQPKPESKGPLGFLQSLYEKSKKKTAERQAIIEQNPLKALLQEVGSGSMLPYSPYHIARVIREQFGGDTPGALEKFDPSVAGWARGGTELVQAPAQLIANAIPGQIGQDVNQSVDATKRFFDETFRPDVIGPLQAKTVPFLLGAGAAARPATATDAVGLLKQILAGGGKGAATGAVINAATEPVYDAKTRKDYFKAKLGQAGTGAKFGGALGAAAPVLSKALSSSSKYDVSKLGEELRTKATDVADDMKIIDNLIAGGDRDIVKRAEILKDTLSKAGDDLATRQQISLGISELQDKAARNALYAVRDKAAAEAGINVDQTPILSIIDNSIEQAKKGIPDKTSINTLTELRNRLDPEMAGGTSFGPIGSSFPEMSSLRSDLGDIVRKSYAGENSLTGSKGGALFQPIKEAVSDAMTRAAQESGSNVSMLDEAANVAHRAYKTKWGWAPVRNAVESQTPDQFLGTFATKKSADLAGGIAGSMTPSGVNATKALMFEKALADSGGDPTKFAKSFKTMADASGVFFSGSDAEKLQGFLKIMKISGALGEGTSTLGGAAAGYSMGGGYGALGGAFAPKAISFIGLGGDKANIPIALSKLYSKILMTKPGQDLLLRANSIKPEKLPELWAELPKIVSIGSTPGAPSRQPERSTPQSSLEDLLPKGQEPTLEELLAQMEKR